MDNSIFRKVSTSVEILAIVSAVVFSCYLIISEYLKIERHQYGMPVPLKVFDDETANWQTYRNEERGYEIKVPQLFKINPDIEYTIKSLHPDIHSATFSTTETITNESLLVEVSHNYPSIRTLNAFNFRP